MRFRIAVLRALALIAGLTAAAAVAQTGASSTRGPTVQTPAEAAGWQTLAANEAHVPERREGSGNGGVTIDPMEQGRGEGLDNRPDHAEERATGTRGGGLDGGSGEPAGDQELGIRPGSEEQVLH